MADSKIEIKVGSITFSGEGPGEWLGKQLDKVLTKIPELARVAGVEAEGSDAKSEATLPVKTGKSAKPTTTLAAFLKEKKATTNQNRKFLATAAWLHDHEGHNRVNTAQVSAALNTNNQGKLRNPAQALIRNAGKGHVVKDGKSFYVSDDGRTELQK